MQSNNNSISIPMEHWKQLIEAIQVDDVVQFSAIVKSDSRVLNVKPCDAQPVECKETLPSITLEQIALNFYAEKVLNSIYEVTNGKQGILLSQTSKKRKVEKLLHEQLIKNRVKVPDWGMYAINAGRYQPDYITALKKGYVGDKKAHIYEPFYNILSFQNHFYDNFDPIAFLLLNNHLALAEEYLRDPNICLKTPYLSHNLAASNNVQALALLRKYHWPINEEQSRKNNSISTLHVAVRSKAVETVKYLLENYANVNAINNEGQTPLHFISWNAKANPQPDKELKMAMILIKHGANVNALDKKRTSPLHGVVNFLTAELLLENGADVNACDSDGNMPLNSALEDPNHDVVALVETLLAHGANPNGKITAYDKSPLISAMYKWHNHNRKALVFALINAGANLQVLSDEFGTSPTGTLLDCALKEGYSSKITEDLDIANLLISKGCHYVIYSKGKIDNASNLEIMASLSKKIKVISLSAAKELAIRSLYYTPGKIDTFQDSNVNTNEIKTEHNPSTPKPAPRPNRLASPSSPLPATISPLKLQQNITKTYDSFFGKKTNNNVLALKTLTNDALKEAEDKSQSPEKVNFNHEQLYALVKIIVGADAENTKISPQVIDEFTQMLGGRLDAFKRLHTFGFLNYETYLTVCYPPEDQAKRMSDLILHLSELNTPELKQKIHHDHLTLIEKDAYWLIPFIGKKHFANLCLTPYEKLYEKIFELHHIYRALEDITLSYVIKEQMIKAVIHGDSYWIIDVLENADWLLNFVKKENLEEICYQPDKRISEIIRELKYLMEMPKQEQVSTEAKELIIRAVIQGNSKNVLNVYAWLLEHDILTYTQKVLDESKNNKVENIIDNSMIIFQNRKILTLDIQGGIIDSFRKSAMNTGNCFYTPNSKFVSTLFPEAMIEKEKNHYQKLFEHYISLMQKYAGKIVDAIVILGPDHPHLSEFNKAVSQMPDMAVEFAIAIKYMHRINSLENIKLTLSSFHPRVVANLLSWLNRGGILTNDNRKLIHEFAHELRELPALFPLESPIIDRYKAQTYQRVLEGYLQLKQRENTVVAAPKVVLENTLEYKEEPLANIENDNNLESKSENLTPICPTPGMNYTFGPEEADLDLLIQNEFSGDSDDEDLGSRNSFTP